MEKHWMAIYSKPRSEKKVAERLEKAGVEVYCPLQTTVRQWSDRKKKVKVPVFPSYVFVRVTEQGRLAVLQDPGVMNFVFWLGKPAIIRDEEILALMAFLDESVTSSADIKQFNKGDKVDIVAGNFRGEKGYITEIRKSEITLLVESLGIVVRIRISPKYIKTAL